MNIKAILTSLTGLAIIIGLAVYNHKPTQKVTEAVVTSPSLTLTANTISTESTTNKVKNITLDADNAIVLNSEVTTSSVEEIIAKIQENERTGEDLYIILDCPGGSVFDGARLISYMESARIKVNTVVYGLAASMCSHIAAHGAKRYALTSGTLMYHSAAGGVQGTVPQMRALLDYVDLETQKLDAYIADRSGIKRETFAQMTLKNLWISGQEAKKLGLVDELVTVSIKNANLGAPPNMDQNHLDALGNINSTLPSNPLKKFH